MNKFRIHPHEPRRSIDGFIPSTGGLRDEGSLDSWESQNNPSAQGISFELPKNKEDGFHSNSSQRSQMNSRLQALPSLEPHHQHAHAKRKHKIRPSKKAIRKTALIVMVMGFVFGGYFFGRAWLTTNKVLRGGGDGALALNSEVDPTQLNGEGDGRVNIMLLGIGGDNHPGADLTDSILIASVDPIGKEASLLSVPRDLWVRVPDYYTMRINAVYTNGKDRAINEDQTDANAEKAGISLLKSVLQETMGIPIHYYVLVNFDAFQQGVDAVGGIDINVKEPLYDYVQAWDNGNNPLIAAAGPQTFNGKRALLYARSRDGSSDFARGERQREVTVALKDKVLGLGTFSNPLAVSKLIDTVGDNVTTSLAMGEIMRLYEISKEIPSSSIRSLGFTDEPNVLVSTANINGQSVVVPRRGTNDFSEIQSFVRNSLRDGFLKSENANVAVLNGTDIGGLATAKAEELMSYGYNVVHIGDAPNNVQNTRLIDFSNSVKKYTRRYLEQRLGVTAVSSLEGIDPKNYNADFVVIVGINEN